MIRIAFIGLLATAAFAAPPPPATTAGTPGDAERLRLELLAQRPAENSSINATLKLRSSDGTRREIAVSLRTELTGPDTWRAIYEATPATPGSSETLSVIHRKDGPNEYSIATNGSPTALNGTAIYRPFAGSDFSAADLGLEFFHWPGAQIARSEMRRGRPCKVLVSLNPDPTRGGYAKVASWIDTETGGLLRAEAYDTNGRQIKEFSLRSFKKVDGRWQLREMEIISYPQDSRTRLEFDLTVESDNGGTP